MNSRQRLSYLDRVGMGAVAAIVAGIVLIYLSVAFAPELQLFQQLFR